MEWEVEFTDEFEELWNGLSADHQESVTAGVRALMRVGPALGRPLVDNVHQSRHPNMKELRAPASNLRVLFAFDPRRTAILLIIGDKTGRWQEWYDEMIPVADDLYDAHLEEITAEVKDDA